MNDKVRRVAIYARVSSNSQKERETVKTQLEELRASLTSESIVIAGVYVDEAFSGPMPLEERPEGSRLMADARLGRFDEVWFFKVDRLGRDEIDPHVVRRELDKLGIKLHSLHENIESPLEFGLRVLFAAEERRGFLVRTAAGMDRAAREGRYCGGIVPLGYRVDGAKQHARLVTSDIAMWGDRTEADIARLIFERLVEGYSCTKISVEFNALAIPTAYGKDGRGIRGKRTQEIWRPNRIYSLATNPVYRGVQRYGRHSKKPGGREIISAPAPRLVSDEIWYAAQETLHGHNLNPDGKRTVYLLRSLMTCATCGQRYGGATSGDRPGRYRCGGQLTSRRSERPRCSGKSIRCDTIDEIVWDDIERFLRDPGDLLAELEQESAQATGAAAAAEADRVVLSERLEDLAQQHKRGLDLRVRGRMTDAELDETLDRIEQDRKAVEARLLALEASIPAGKDISPDLLAEIRLRLDGGLSPGQRQEVAHLLVKGIIVYTEGVNARQKSARIRIEYSFPSCVVPSHTGSRCRPCRPSPRCLLRTDF